MSETILTHFKSRHVRLLFLLLPIFGLHGGAVLTHLTFGLFLAFWWLEPIAHLKQKYHWIKAQPWLRPLLLFGSWIVLTIFYGAADTPSPDIHRAIKKYLTLLYIPFFSSEWWFIAQQENASSPTKTRKACFSLGTNVYVTSCVLMAVLYSLKVALEIDLPLPLPSARFKQWVGEARRHGLILDHIFMGLFFAVASFWCSVKAFYSTRPALQISWLFIGLFLAGTTLAISTGRTGQVILISLLLIGTSYAFYSSIQGRTRLKILLLSLLLPLGSLLLLDTIPTSTFKSRFQMAIHEFQNRADTEVLRHTSIGQRWGFWEGSLLIWKTAPWLGHGTGSFKNQYQKIQQHHPHLPSTRNPHQAYLLLLAEQGLIGLLLFLYFIGSLYRSMKREGPLVSIWGKAILWSFLLGCFANSWTQDLPSRHWFAWTIPLCLF